MTDRYFIEYREIDGTWIAYHMDAVTPETQAEAVELYAAIDFEMGCKQLRVTHLCGDTGRFHDVTLQIANDISEAQAEAMIDAMHERQESGFGVMA